MSCLHLPVTANSPVKLTKIFTKDYASYYTPLSGEQYDLAIITRLLCLIAIASLSLSTDCNTSNCIKFSFLCEY